MPAHIALPAAPQKRSRRTVAVAGALGAVVLVVVGGTAAWLSGRDDTAKGMSATQTITRTVIRDPAPLPDVDAGLPPVDRDLLGMIVNPESCTPDKDRIGAAVAAVTCGPTSPSSGQQTAYFALFDDADDLERAFQDVIADDALVPCPNSEDSPTNWSYQEAAPDEDSGLLACGEYEGFADIVWTRGSDLLLATAKGRHLDRLYDWWLNNA